jgi:hypothetical protein
VLKIVFSGVVLAQLSNTPRAIKNELLIVCFLLRESDLHRGLFGCGKGTPSNPKPHKLGLTNRD